jgi:hypothetical protein
MTGREIIDKVATYVGAHVREAAIAILVLVVVLMAVVAFG